MGLRRERERKTQRDRDRDDDDREGIIIGDREFGQERCRAADR